MKKIIIILSIFFALFGINVVHANYGLDTTAEKAGLKTAVQGGSVADIIGNVIGQALTLVGVLFLLLMIYGGFIWMIARGNEQQTDKALNTIKAAIIGLVIVLASYAITNFIFNAISGNATSSTETVTETLTGSCTNVVPTPLTCTSSPDCTENTSQTTCEAVPDGCCQWNS